MIHLVPPIFLILGLVPVILTPIILRLVWTYLPLKMARSVTALSLLASGGFVVFGRGPLWLEVCAIATFYLLIALQTWVLLPAVIKRKKTP